MELHFPFLSFNFKMNEIFTATMMDSSPSLFSSRFLQEVTTHASTLAVSPLRPNGLNDLDVCQSSIEFIRTHPDKPNGISFEPVLPLLADASPVDRYNHSTTSADLLIVIQAVQTLKVFALSIVGSVISATLKHPTYGFTRLRLVDIIDHVTLNYGVLSRSDIATLDARLTTYSPSISLAQNFTIFDQTHALLAERNLPVPETRMLDLLYTALQPNLTQKVRFDQYLSHHPNRTTQSYAKAKKYLLQLERSLADLPLSSLVPVALPPLAAAAVAPAQPPTAFEFAALKAQIAALQKTIQARDTSPLRSVRVSQPSTRVSTPCRQCAAASPPVHVLFSKCKAHNPHCK